MKKKNSFGCWFFILSYWLLVNHSPCSLFGLQNAAPDINKTILNNLASATDPNSNFKKKLLRIELNMPEVENHDITKSELRKMIEKIRSINFDLPKEIYEPVVVPHDVPKSEPNETILDNVKEQPKKIKVENKKLSNGVITSQTLEIIMRNSQDPNNLENPFELGEILFLCGYIKEAVVFYQEALKRKSPDKADFVRDRSWILFQIGNCLRDVDRREAISVYGQLITEYPNSSWKELAEVRRALLVWYMKEEPRKLIKERAK